MSTVVITQPRVREIKAEASMIRSRLRLTGGVAVIGLTLTGLYLSPAQGSVTTGSARTAVAQHQQLRKHPKSGVGSCTLKGWNPKHSTRNAKSLPLGHRHQTYIADNYDCEGAVFTKPGVEFRKFPQPKNFRIANSKAVRLVRLCRAGACREHVIL
jgi:hypothetical protein